MPINYRYSIYQNWKIAILNESTPPSIICQALCISHSQTCKYLTVLKSPALTRPEHPEPVFTGVQRSTFNVQQLFNDPTWCVTKCCVYWTVDHRLCEWSQPRCCASAVYTKRIWSPSQVCVNGHLAFRLAGTTHLHYHHRKILLIWST